jgi:hypothetical protein
MLITLHTPTKALQTDRYTSTKSALRHWAVPLAKGKPFTLEVHHNGQTQTNRYNEAGDYLGQAACTH